MFRPKRAPAPCQTVHRLKQPGVIDRLQDVASLDFRHRPQCCRTSPRCFLTLRSSFRSTSSLSSLVIQPRSINSSESGRSIRTAQPCAHIGELRLIDQVVLKRDHGEQEIAINIDVRRHGNDLSRRANAPAKPRSLDHLRGPVRRSDSARCPLRFSHNPRRQVELIWISARGPGRSWQGVPSGTRRLVPGGSGWAGRRFPRHRSRAETTPGRHRSNCRIRKARVPVRKTHAAPATRPKPTPRAARITQRRRQYPRPGRDRAAAWRMTGPGVARRAGDEQAHAQVLGRRFHATGQVYSMPQRAIFELLLATCVTDKCHTRVEADSQTDFTRYPAAPGAHSARAILRAWPGRPGRLVRRDQVVPAVRSTWRAVRRRCSRRRPRPIP